MRQLQTTVVVLLLTGCAHEGRAPTHRGDWAAKCASELERARALLIEREPRFAQARVERFGGTAEEWVVDPAGEAVQLSGCLEKGWCFTAVATPLELSFLPRDEVPLTWDSLPETTVCLSDGRRTGKLMGWLRADFNAACAWKNKAPEVLLFVEATRPAVDACLRNE